ncbi:hypothetical protein D3C71_1750740 [compost metagenome]
MRPVKPGQQAASGRFSAARFTYQRKCFTSRQRKADIFDRMHARVHHPGEGGSHLEPRRQVPDLEKLAARRVDGIGPLLLWQCLSCFHVDNRERTGAIFAGRTELRHRGKQGARIGLLRAGKDF